MAATSSTWTISASTISVSCGRRVASSTIRSGQPAASHEPITDQHRDLAFALQVVTEEMILHIVRALLKKFPQRDLCMTGGVALNCVANGKILEHTDVRRIWVPPCASDTGAPLGSALWHYHQSLGRRARLRADAPLLRPSLQRRPNPARAPCRGSALSATSGGAPAAPGCAGPGGRQDRRLVPGPVRNGTARARQSLDPGRSAPPRHARRAQCQGEAARVVSPVRAGGAARTGRRSSSRSSSPTRS